MSDTVIDRDQWLGPFLCKPSHESMGFWLCKGPNWKKGEKIEIEVADENGTTLPRLSLRKIGAYNSFIGVVAALKAKSRYSYKVFVDGEEWRHSHLKESDFNFVTLSKPDETNDIKFLLMSCHGMEAYEKHKSEYELDPKKVFKKSLPHTWNVWDKLENALRREPCALGILGGDQVYMDDTFKDRLQDFDLNNDVDTRTKVFNTYYKYWNEPVYRRIMAQLPCLLMWDDHDLIDGWGSRAEMLRDPERWNKYRDMLKEAFLEMQACRNPGILNEKNSYTFFFEYGPYAFMGLDLRLNRELLKNSIQSQMMSQVQKDDISAVIQRLSKSTKTLFWISPVTVARMGGDIERLLGGVSNFVWSMAARFGYGKSLMRGFFWSLIFSLIYLSLYVETESFPGFVQSIATAVICTLLLLFNWSDINRYFPNRYRLVRSVIAAVGIASGISAFLLVFFKKDTDLFPVLWSETSDWFCRTFGDTLTGLTSAVLVIGTFALLKSERIDRLRAKHLGISSIWGQLKTPLKCINISSLIIFVAFTTWRGLPGWKLQLFTIWLLFIYIPLLAAMLASFAVAIGEATGAIDELAGLDDDVRDAWSAEANAEELKFLIEQMREARQRNVGKQVLLCGDIHTGGLSEVTIPESDLLIPQITSSPMSYVTMPHLVEKLTSATGIIPLKHDKETLCLAGNIFYRSERNFVIITASHGEMRTDFYFEDLTHPVGVII